eukprot:753014-Hanusia_phi.AAC.2
MQQENRRKSGESLERDSQSLCATESNLRETLPTRSQTFTSGSQGGQQRRRMYFSTRYQVPARKDVHEGENKEPLNRQAQDKPDAAATRASQIRWPWQGEKYERPPFPWHSLHEELRGDGAKAELDSSTNFDVLFNLHYKDVSSSNVSLSELRRSSAVNKADKEKRKTPQVDAGVAVPRARLLARTSRLSLEEEEKRWIDSCASSLPPTALPPLLCTPPHR